MVASLPDFYFFGMVAHARKNKGASGFNPQRKFAVNVGGGSIGNAFFGNGGKLYARFGERVRQGSVYVDTHLLPPHQTKVGQQHSA